MSEELLPPVATDQMRISVEVGEEYQPSDRVGAALAELRDALAEESDETEGFGFAPLRLTFSFDSRAVAGPPAVTLGNNFEEYKVTYTE